jgi:phosphosulfolactate phosphohydrolase-like enzyme
LATCGEHDGADSWPSALFESCGRDYDRVLTALRRSRGGRNLIDCGLESDIALCAVQDQFDFVPELARDAWEVRRTQAS